jgi:DNA repair protein RadC
MSSNFDQSSFMVSEVEIIYRNHVPYNERITVKQSHTAFKILRQSWDENKIELLEQFKILLLDRKSNCLGISEISTGGTSSCIVDPKIVFATALKAKASGLVLAHNHPSGNLVASDADLALTKKLTDGGKLLDIAIIDHLIITAHDFYSFSDNGVMPNPS